MLDQASWQEVVLTCEKHNYFDPHILEGKLYAFYGNDAIPTPLPSLVLREIAQHQHQRETSQNLLLLAPLLVVIALYIGNSILDTVNTWLLQFISTLDVLESQTLTYTAIYEVCNTLGAVVACSQTFYYLYLVATNQLHRHKFLIGTSIVLLIVAEISLVAQLVKLLIALFHLASQYH